METKKQFSLYDFLGYFAPGALFLYILLYFLKYFDELLYQCILNINFGKIELFVAFVIISYIIGHALNYISSITIEKYSNWMYGFPSYFLLFGTKKHYFKKLSFSEKELELDLSGCDLAENFINNYSIRNKSKSKYRFFLSWFFSCIWRLILLIFLLPIFFYDLLVGRIMKLKLFYTNQLDIVLSNAIIKKIQTLFRELNIEVLIGTDFFRVISHYYYENYEKHQSKYDNYVALYGLTRTLSLIFCLTTWLFSFIIIYTHIFCLQLHFSVIIIFFLSGISYLFFMAFMKFYRKYTLEGYMCLLIDKDFN
jgi:hypothetical protein